MKIPSFKDVAVDLLLLAGMQVGKFFLLDGRTVGSKYMIASGFERKFIVIKNFLRELKVKRMIPQSLTVGCALDTPVSRPLAVPGGKFWLLDGGQAWAFPTWWGSTTCNRRETAEISSLSEVTETLKDQGIKYPEGLLI